MSPTALFIMLFGLTAATSWGVSDFLSAKASKSLGPISSAFLVNCIGAVAFIVGYFLFPHPPSHLSLEGVALAVFSGVAMTLAVLTFFKGLDIGPVSLVSPIAAAYPLITTALAVLVFHSQLSPNQIAGILLVTVGVALAAELTSFKQPFRKLSSGPAWALGTALGWGIGFCLLAQSVAQLGWELATLIELFFIGVTLIVLLPIVKGGEDISVKHLGKMMKNKFIIGAGLIQLVGVLAINFGLSHETVSGGAIVTAISACYPVLTILLALRHFKEKVKLVPLAGAFVSIIGVVTLSLR